MKYKDKVKIISWFYEWMEWIVVKEFTKSRDMFEWEYIWEEVKIYWVIFNDWWWNNFEENELQLI